MNLRFILCPVFCFFLSFSYSAQSFSAEKQAQVDSVVAIINSGIEDTVKALYLLELSGYYFRADPDTTILLCEEAKELSFKNDFTEGKIKSLGWLGYLYKQRGKVDFALNQYFSALKVCEGDDELEIEFNRTLFSNIASAYYSIGNIPKALEYFDMAYKASKDIGDKRAMSVILNNIGSVYKEQGDFEQGIEYMLEAVEIGVEINAEFDLASTYNNLGITYVAMDEPDVALGYFEKSLEICQRLEDNIGIGKALRWIGGIYKVRDKDKALEYYEEALRILEVVGDKNGLASILNELGLIYFENGEYSIALTYASRGMKLSKELGFPDQVLRAAKLLSELSEHKGDYKKAFEMHSLYVQMKDSIRNSDTEKAAIKQQAKHEYEKIITQDSIVNAEAHKVLNAEVKLQQAEAEKQRQAKKYLYIGLAFLALFGVFIFNRLRVSRKQQKLIEQQKIAVDKSNDELKEQKDKIHLQKEQIEEKNKEVMDSIVYAKRLQQAILPSRKDMDTELKDGFVLFQPKDVVSGDFYWMYSDSENNNKVYFAAADCTGHGVPGAMVSVVCSNALDRAVKEYDLTDTGEILDKVTDLVIERFDKSGDNVKDGMDIALCAVDFEKNTLQYSGANNPLWILKEKARDEVVGEREVSNETHIIKEYKASKQPIGNFPLREKFETHNLTLNKGDIVYVFTDGFADQFGGVRGKKFKYKPFKKLILDNQNLSMEAQKDIIQKAFDSWKGELEQIDDVCIIGVRV